VVRQICDHKEIGLAKGIVEGLHLAAHRLEQLLDGLAAAGTTLLKKPSQNEIVV
jgi:hypothetical protein